MNICVVTHTFPRYTDEPVAPFMEDFCRGLSEEGHTVTLLAPFDRTFTFKSPHYAIELYRYIVPSSLHLLGYSRTLKNDQYLGKGVFFLAPLMFFFCFWKLLFLVRRKKIDVISAHWIVPNGFIAALVSKLTGIPLIITVPGSDMYLAKTNRLFRWMASIAVGQAKYIVSNSNVYLDEFPKFGITLPKTAEIPYGVSVEKYRFNGSFRQHMRKKNGIMANEFVVLAVGRLVEKKGFQYLIDAVFHAVKQEKKIRLKLIGSGSDEEKLKSLVKKRHLEKYVTFIGRVDYKTLATCYAFADLYVASSIEDSKGNMESHIVALFEAIASGLPVVVTNIAATSTFVKDGYNGYRISQKNPQAMASAIVSVARSKKRREMGTNSRKIAKKYLSYKRSAREFSKILGKIQ